MLNLGMFLAKYYTIEIYNWLILNISVKKMCFFNRFVNQGRLT